MVFTPTSERDAEETAQCCGEYRSFPACHTRVIAEHHQPEAETIDEHKVQYFQCDIKYNLSLLLDIIVYTRVPLFL